MRAGEVVSSYIGKEVVLHGEISGTDDLYIDGTFEGTIQLEDSRLTIGPNARVTANIQSRDVVVLGEVKGDVRATGRVELRHTSNLTGDLYSVHLMVEEGAVVVGKVDLAPPARPEPVRPAASTLHEIYSGASVRKEQQPESSGAAVAVASNG